jgi:hypothetical protein
MDPFGEEPEPAKKKQMPPLAVGVIHIVAGCVVAGWLSIAILSPHAWTIPTYSQMLSATGTFDARGLRRRGPYAFRQSDGSLLGVSCYPESVGNECVADFDGLVGKPVTIRYFVIPPENRGLLQAVFGSTPNILMEIDGPRGAALTFRQSVVRLQEWSSDEPKDYTWNLLLVYVPICAFFVLTGALIVYRRIRYPRGRSTDV